MFKHITTDKNHTFIKSSLEIYNLLKTIQKSRQLISLSFESLPKHCLTSLLEVHHGTQVLIFDEPYPVLSDKLVATKDEAEFSLKLNGLPVNFKSRFILNKKKSSNDLYVPFPDEIYYPQNRQYHRFRTEFIDSISAKIYLSKTRQLSCSLINISLNGLCLRLPYSFASMFQLNQTIDDIYIELPKLKGFSIAAKIKNARIENNYSHITLGLEINERKANIEKVIQQFIFRTENI